MGNTDTTVATREKTAEPMPALARLKPRPVVQSKTRDAHFDILKGFLVLIMVAHHTLEYFAGPNYPLIRYLDFVTGGFVFAAGFLSSFTQQLNPVVIRVKAARRLLTRGFKILAVFIVVNCLLGLTFHQSSSGKSFGGQVIISHLPRILIAGDKRLVAFAILVPIAYTLIALAVLTVLTESKWTLCIVAAILLGYDTAIAPLPYNLYFLAMGLSGAAAGKLVDRAAVVSASRTAPRALMLTGAALYMGAITVLPSDNAILYVAGIFCVLASAYAYAGTLELFRLPFSSLVMLGRYSLVGYLAQIFFLQILARGAARPAMEWGLGAIPLILTTIFLWGLCSGLDFLRGRYATISYAYRLVFA
jgi:hypothetical protein